MKINYYMEFVLISSRYLNSTATGSLKLVMFPQKDFIMEY